MASMTDQNRVNSILNYFFNLSGSLPAQPSAHHLRNMTAQGSNTSNGTEATSSNCPGYTAGGVAMTWGAASSGQIASSNSPSWTATGSWSTITSCEDWDTAGTPLRWLQGALTANITGVSNGDTVQYATGAVTANASAW
jgi:hypothetical protein